MYYTMPSSLRELLKKTFIFSGEIHYFRVHPSLWHDRLLKAKRAFLNTITTYIAWNWHEPRENVFLFNDGRDVERFMDIVSELGMYLIARPGPYICSEWDGGGHPGWLYGKKCLLRSLDPIYMKYALRWYDVIMPIIARKLRSRGGSVILLQVENEYFWGNLPFILALYEYARKYAGDAVPIVTNEIRAVRATNVADTLDLYPDPWRIEDVKRRVREIKTEQPETPPFVMELEGGWFALFGKPWPTERGDFPAEWTEVLVKTLLGLGIKGLNIYMFHGGTNPVYYTGKYITTSYDYQAAVSETGFLTERYYVLRRIGALVKYFGEVLRSGVEDGAWKGENCSVFAITSSRGSIIFARNLVEEDVKARIEGPDLSFETVLPARSMKAFLANYAIADTGIYLKYSTAEPFAILSEGERAILVIYGDEEYVSETLLESAYAMECRTILGNASIEFSEDKRRVIVRSDHRTDTVVEFTHRDKRLLLVFVPKYRAERTWIVDEIPLVVISDIYLMREYSINGQTVTISFEDIGDKDLILIGRVEPLEGFFELRKISDGIFKARVRFEVEEPSAKWLGGWVYREREKPSIDELRKVEPYTPLEELGFPENGVYEYVIKFRAPENLVNKQVYLSAFCDHVTLLVNGRFVAQGYRSLETEAPVDSGENEFYAILDATGRSNDGIVRLLNGIHGGIYLGKLGEEELRVWRCVRIPETRDLVKRFGVLALRMDVSSMLYRPLEDPLMRQLMALKDGEEMRERIEGNGVYSKDIIVDSLDYRYILYLEGARPGFLVILVNGEHAGSWGGFERDRCMAFDITQYLRPGRNELKIIEFGGDGLEKVILKKYQFRISGEWYVRRAIEGLGEDVVLKEKVTWLQQKPSKVLFWAKRALAVKVRRGIVAPLKLIVKSDGRCLLFFNGKSIGRYVPEGPQEEFYVPEPLIEDGENTVLIFAINASRLEVEPKFDYIHALKEVKLRI